MRAPRMAAGAAALSLLLLAIVAPASAATGPHMVKDILPSGDSEPFGLTAVGTTLFFSAKGPGGRELWKSDGTAVGTERVKNIRPGADSSWPINLTDVGGTLFFSAFDGTDWGIWKSDGTNAGTQIVDYIEADHLTSFQGMLYFVTYDELWRTDGTSSGTTLVKKVASFPDTFVGEMEVVGNRLFISVGLGDATTDELWVSDGTEDGTTLVKALSHTHSEGIRTLTSAGGRLFFLRNEGHASEFGPESAQLWTSNGTSAGTRRVKDFVPGELDYVDNLIAAGGRAFVIADGDSAHPDGGLWKSNGFASGTKPLGASAYASYPLTSVGGTVHFVGVGGIWKSDGTTAGTQHVSDIVPHTNTLCDPHGPCGFVPRDYDPAGLAGQLFFPAKGRGLGIELWQTDGSADGKALVGDLRPGSKGSRPADLTKVGGTLYFTANDGTHGRELWRYVP